VGNRWPALGLVPLCGWGLCSSGGCVTEKACLGCQHPVYSDCVNGYEHTCGLPHIAREGTRGYQCGGVGSKYPCPRCEGSPKGTANPAAH
jgi:hypothetical protein